MALSVVVLEKIRVDGKSSVVREKSVRAHNLDSDTENRFYDPLCSRQGDALCLFLCLNRARAMASCGFPQYDRPRQ